MPKTDDGNTVIQQTIALKSYPPLWRPVSDLTLRIMNMR
jgi:hypothetical protein